MVGDIMKKYYIDFEGDYLKEANKNNPASEIDIKNYLEQLQEELKNIKPEDTPQIILDSYMHYTKCNT